MKTIKLKDDRGDNYLINVRDDVGNLIANQEQQIKVLKEYTRHYESCKIVVLSHPEDCTCGLNELLNKH